jgi:hypothetical protein
MLNSYPQELLQAECQSIVEEILKEKYVLLSVHNFILREEEKTKIECDIVFSNDWDTIFISGVGEGAIDALYVAMINVFSDKFISLRRVSFDDFTLSVKFKKSVRKSASPVEVKLALKNASGKNIYFSSESCSIVKAAILVVASACEYLINAERTILELRDLIDEAEGRRRTDLVEKYRDNMVELVKITSYDEVL